MVEYIKIAVFFAVGVYLYQRIDMGFTLIFMLSLILVLTISTIFKHKFNIKILLLMSSLVLGMVLCKGAVCEELKDLSEYTGRYVTLTGRISEIPQQSDNNVKYVVDVRKAVHKDVEKSFKEKILLTAKDGFEYGDTITFSGFVETFSEKMSSDVTDFELYYKGSGIFFKMYSDCVNIDKNTIRDYSPYALGVSVKNFVSNIIDEHYTDDYNAILKAVLTGNKKEFSDEFDKILTRTGAKRFFYPAYLHVALFMAIITLLLSMVNRKKRDIIMLFLLIIYAIVNSSNAVFIRITVFFAVLLFTKIRVGRVYYIDAIGITILIVGILNPLLFFNTGFAMSILASVFIYYFHDFVYTKLKFVHLKYVRSLLSLGIICTIGLMPVTAYFFNSLSIYSIFLSLVMLPSVAIIVALSPILILMLVLFNTAPVIGQVVTCIVFVLELLPRLADKLYFSYIILPKPNILFLIIYVFVVVAAVKFVKDKKQHAKIALFVAAALMTSGVVTQIMRLNDVDVTFVNVGQGDGAVVSAPYRFNILIDGGGGNNYSDYNPGETMYLEYLKTKGISNVDSAFVSHYHKDHVQGIIAAMENIKVRNLFMPDCMEGSEWRVALENTAKESNTKIHYISEETLLTYKNGMTIRIVPPAPKTKISDDENDTSLVYYLDYGEFSCVFTGDMSEFAEKNLIDIGKTRETDVLKTAHHGSKTSTSTEWVEAIKPKYAVISVGEDNTFALPNDEVLENLKNTKVFRTDYDGDICFTAEKDGIVEIRTFNRREIWQ